MDAIASQITSLNIVYSIVYSDADQIQHQSSASLAFVRGNHRDRWIPRTNGQLRASEIKLIFEFANACILNEHKNRCLINVFDFQNIEGCV